MKDLPFKEGMKMMIYDEMTYRKQTSPLAPSQQRLDESVKASMSMTVFYLFLQLLAKVIYHCWPYATIKDYQRCVFFFSFLPAKFTS